MMNIEVNGKQVEARDVCRLVGVDQTAALAWTASAEGIVLEWFSHRAILWGTCIGLGGTSAGAVYTVLELLAKGV